MLATKFRYGQHELDRLDALTNIGDVLQHAGVCSHADQELELRICCAKPQERDQHRKDNCAHWIDPPPDLGAKDRGHETNAVDEEIVAVVFPQDANLAVRVAQRPTIAE